eukprot:CAMPEP_0173330518 /NCGR_PEP_ID=MMETSP1144-20121109/3288_1 /TAXON_ID=483371 /ORGANISM="non described non described, Strain CCMP2298" /LENGTH=502 /DNA_ID=CAMNT_0014275193 /DNA_START=40 /DNA_END=1546 /DNA_ORIENTATION=-
MESVMRFSEDFCASSILLHNNSTIAYTTDCSALADNAIEHILQDRASEGKAVYYNLLAAHASRSRYARLSQLADRLPTLIEAAAQNAPDRSALLRLLDVMFEEYSDDFAVQLPKVLARVVTTVVRASTRSSASSCEFGLGVLLLMGRSRARSLLLPHSKAVRGLCMDVLEPCMGSVTDKGMGAGAGVGGHTHALIGEVYALYVSLETPEQWVVAWNILLQEANNVLALGIGVGAEGANGMGGGGKRGDQTVHIPFALLKNCKIAKMRGADRATLGRYLFHGLCCLLSRMLAVGCSSGFAPLDVTLFLPLLSSLLNTRPLDMSTRDPAVFIDSGLGTSAFDRTLVLSLLKTDLLFVVRALLDLNHPTIVRIGMALVRPVAALLARPEGRLVRVLNSALLACLASAARVLPAVVAASVNNTNMGLVQRLAVEIASLSSNQSIASQSSGAASGASGAGVVGGAATGSGDSEPQLKPSIASQSSGAASGASGAGVVGGAATGSGDS